MQTHLGGGETFMGRNVQWAKRPVIVWCMTSLLCCRNIEWMIDASYSDKHIG